MIGIEWFPFSHSCDLEWGQGHEDTYLNVELNTAYHYTMFEPNQFINGRMEC